MNDVNQKIIHAVIEKANKACPDSLALIGIYGSVATGDAYDKSDLDLLILIEKDEGRKLGTGFILEDKKVGYDIYCTDLTGLRYDAECHHAHLSKLMDSQIVYVNNQQAYDYLCELRAQVKRFLNSDARFERSEELVEKAKISYANACLSEALSSVRLAAAHVIDYLSDAIMLYHGTYFKRGVKKALEELSRLPIEDVFINTVRQIVISKDVCELRCLLKCLLLYTQNHVWREKNRAVPSDALTGTYEELYSNWRNKVEEATQKNDRFSAFMNICSLQCMLSEISSEVEIGNFNVLDDYNPFSPEDNIKTFDKCLQKYEEVYWKAGISVKRFADVDDFILHYLG